MSSEKHIGLDVHQATTSVEVMDCQGKVIMESILETKASTILEFFAGLRGSLFVTLEVPVPSVPKDGDCWICACGTNTGLHCAFGCHVQVMRSRTSGCIFCQQTQAPKDLLLWWIRFALMRKI